MSTDRRRTPDHSDCSGVTALLFCVSLETAIGIALIVLWGVAMGGM